MQLLPEFGQVGDVHCNPSGLILAEQLGGRSPARLILEIDIGELLAVGVAHDKAGRLVPRLTRAAGSGGLSTHIACLAMSNPFFRSSAFITGSN